MAHSARTRFTGTRFGHQARAVATALLLGAAILSFSTGETAHAARYVAPEAGDTDTNDNPGTGTTIVFSKNQGDLENGGYTCTVVATGFKECTKPGSPTYWCDASGQCEVKPFRGAQTEVMAPRGGVYYAQP